MRPRLFLLCAALAAVTFLWRERQASSQLPAAELPAPAPRVSRGDLARFRLQGAGSCAAAACHNGDALGGTRGREYAVALERDPHDLGQRVKDRHAQAYEVLFGQRSREIEQRLGGLATAAEARPEKNPLCLRCHVHPDFEHQASRERDGVRQSRLEDGVSCETCHGPAEHWLAAHFRPGWAALSTAERRARGMADTRSILGRARLCVDCHVGAANMDVNHDLIAAGHPRLNFELSSYHHFLHKHWDAARDAREPDFEVRAWALGQVASGDAALRLLAARAEHRAAPWPEFAEYDCFACHHDLKSPTWRQSPAPGHKPGALTWNSWYYAELPRAAAALTGRPADAVTRALEDLRQAMESARPDRAQVGRRARQAAQLVGQYLDQGGQLAVAPGGLFRDIVADATERRTETWDGAAQAYLALSALGRAGAAPARGLPTLRGQLRFPDRYDSPRDFDPAGIRAALEALRTKGPR